MDITDHEYRETVKEARAWTEQYLLDYQVNKSNIQQDILAQNRLRTLINRQISPSISQWSAMDYDERSIAATNMGETREEKLINNRTEIVCEVFEGINPTIANVWINSFPDFSTEAYSTIEDLLLDFGIELYFLKKYHLYEYQRCFLDELKHHDSALDWIKKCQAWLQKENESGFHIPFEIKSELFNEFRNENPHLFKQAVFYRSRLNYKTEGKPDFVSTSQLWYYIELDFFACNHQILETKYSGLSSFFDNRVFFFQPP